MHPTIRDGEALTVMPVAAHAVRRGDIILYKAVRGVTAHRVVRIEGERGAARRFHLRGDAALSADAPVSAAQILGRVVAVERAGRQIALSGHRAKLRAALRLCAVRLKARVRAF